MDELLHRERITNGAKRTYRDDLANLPDGAYVAVDGKARLVWGTHLYQWTDSGYSSRQPRRAHNDVDVLTPPSIVAILAAGYRPAIHPTAVQA
jgi:hypothetical protein